ncbi:Probable ribose-5-phosphate isomerase 3, chloroplastic [Linum perenne]
MVLGLGTGSTAAFVVSKLGELLKSGQLKDIVGIPTSKRTEEQARSLGIPLSILDNHPKLDLAIDGADEVDPDLNLVKGHGGALLGEKIVEASSDKFVVVIDDTKLVDDLGGSGEAAATRRRQRHSDGVWSEGGEEEGGRRRKEGV